MTHRIRRALCWLVIIVCALLFAVDFAAAAPSAITATLEPLTGGAVRVTFQLPQGTDAWRYARCTPRGDCTEVDRGVGATRIDTIVLNPQNGQRYIVWATMRSGDALEREVAVWRTWVPLVKKDV